jgi:hypothetical protein
MCRFDSSIFASLAPSTFSANYGSTSCKRMKWKATHHLTREQAPGAGKPHKLTPKGKVGSIPTPATKFTGKCLSGRKGQTVNLVACPTEVRIHPLPTNTMRTNDYGSRPCCQRGSGSSTLPVRARIAHVAHW